MKQPQHTTIFFFSSLLLILHLFCSSYAAEIVLKPSNTGRPVGFILVGRNDVDVSIYVPFGQQVQKSLGSDLSVWFVIKDNLQDVDVTLNTLSANGVNDIFFVGHSMSDGGIQTQTFVKNKPAVARGLILLSSFLQRNHRPDLQVCYTRAADQPALSLHYPLGYLKDHAHDCFGGNSVSYPLPVLTIGGELDGVVRLGRFAEAFYTQQVLSTNSSLPIVIIKGMNHANLLNSTGFAPPTILKQKDLRAEQTADQSRAEVAQTMNEFIRSILGLTTVKSVMSIRLKDTSDFLAPLINAFVNQEGNWFFTGMDDEHGESPFGAFAQEVMADPLPRAYKFATSNQFHMLTDEPEIPPYYRDKHRPDIHVDNQQMLITTSTVSQLRFRQLSVFEAGFGLNGWAIIKEEKVNVLNDLPDVGDDYVSAIEISTKLASRQLIYNMTGEVNPPPTLDDGDRCASINQLAYLWAQKNAGNVTLDRFSRFGLPMVMGPDQAATPSAGPFWIWSYLEYKLNSTSAMEIRSYKAFFGLDAAPYGRGNHYCKLLSPARVMEWIYTDSLRFRYGL